MTSPRLLRTVVAAQSIQVEPALDLRWPPADFKVEESATKIAKAAVLAFS